MTNVYLERDGDRFTVSAKGHATGSVEMCAAISTLLYTLDAWLHNTTSTVLHESLEPGDALLEYAGGDHSDAIFFFVTIGFLQLEQSYPTTITVETNFIT